MFWILSDHSSFLIFVKPQDRVEYEIQKAAAFAARASKRKLKDKPIRAFEDETAGKVFVHFFIHAVHRP